MLVSPAGVQGEGSDGGVVGTDLAKAVPLDRSSLVVQRTVEP